MTTEPLPVVCIRRNMPRIKLPSRNGSKDRRRHAKHSRDALPMHSIRIRSRGRGGAPRVRFIKVGYERSKTGWMPLARFTWEETKGPVPPGMRVVHSDGNTLNDDPENYELMTGGQVALLHWTKPGVYNRMKERRRKALITFNKDKSLVFRGTVKYLANRWYLVDETRRLILNDPRRMVHQLVNAHLEPFIPTKNGRGWQAVLRRHKLIAVRGHKLRDESFREFRLCDTLKPSC